MIEVTGGKTIHLLHAIEKGKGKGTNKWQNLDATKCHSTFTRE